MGRNNQKKLELLAPAGSLASVVAAVNAGADAVYMGGPRFGARAYAESAKAEEGDMLLQAINHCHLFGVKLYMTVNTLFKDDELKELFSYIKPYYEAGVDGVIVQDLGAAACLRRWFPDLELHASTQMTITGPAGAAYALSQGMSRVVLARELNLKQIRNIYEETGAEMEVFIHGAMCYSYSGACYMSSLLGGRSGNRGRCAGTCRLCYEVAGRKAYYLSLKDMCTLEFLPDMIQAGVYSMKIEGRMKSPAYTAGVVSVYRKYMDLAQDSPENYRVDPADLKLLRELFDRGGWTDYLKRHNGREMIALEEKKFREVDDRLIQGVKAAYIDQNRKITLDGELYLEVGAPAVLTLQDEAGVTGVAVSEAVVEAASKRPVTAEEMERQLRKTGGTCYQMGRVSVTMPEPVFLPLRQLNALRRSALEIYEKEKLGESRRVWSAFRAVSAQEEAERSRVTDVMRVAERSGASGVAGDTVSNCTTGAVQDADQGHVSGVAQATPQLRVSVETEEQFEAALAASKVQLIYLDLACFSLDILERQLQRCHEAGKQAGLRLPRISEQLDAAGTAAVEQLLKAGMDAVLLRAFEQIGWMQEILKRCKKSAKHFELVYDYTVYGYNAYAAAVLQEAGADRLTDPIELNFRELKRLRKEASSRADSCTLSPDWQDAETLQASREKFAGASQVRMVGSVGEAPRELLVYGHLPMMVSANCVKKTAQGCNRGNEILGLKDRMGKEMKVRCYCKYCYNQIYNAEPLVLYDLKQEIAALRPASLRYDFSVESGEQTAAVLAGSWQPRQMTRGHFKRGVE